MNSRAFPFERNTSAVWSDLVSQIYDCALDEETWPATVDSIMKTVGGTGAQFVTLAGHQHETISDFMINLDTERALREFDKLVAAGQQTRVRWAVHNPQLNLLYDYQHSSEAEMMSSLFYQEHARPLGVDYYAAIVCRPRPAHITGLVLFREKSFGHFSPEQIAFFDSLAPHVEKALLLSETIGRANVAAGVESVLSAIPVGALAIDDRLNVVGINALGEAAGKDAVEFSVARSSIRNSSTQVIDAVLQQVKPRRGPGARRSERRMILSRRSGLSGYQFVFTHMTSKYAAVHGGLCLILVIDPESEADLPPELIAEAFALTPTESTIVRMLVAGRNINEIARARRCHVDTVRTHVKSALNKTGCRRQAELVALVLRQSIF